MKILIQNRDKAVAQIQPIAFWLFGVIFAFVGLLLIAILGTCTTFNCDKGPENKGICELKITGIISEKKFNIPVSDIKGAEVKVFPDSDGDDTYQITLLTNNGPINFTSYSSSGYSSKKDTVNQINDFINNPSHKTISVGQDDRLLAWIFGGVFLIIGLLVVFLVAQITCYIDYRTQKLSIIKKSLLKTETFTFRFSEIVDFTIETSYGSKGSDTYRVVIELSSGENFPITSYYSSGYKDKQDQVAFFRYCLNKTGG